MLIYYHERSGIMYFDIIKFESELNRAIETFCRDYCHDFDKIYEVSRLREKNIFDSIKFSIYKLVSIYELKYPDHIIDILMKDVESKPISFFVNHLDSVFGRNFGRDQEDIDWINIMNIEDILPSLANYQRFFLKAPYSYEYQYFYPKDNSNLQFKLKLSDDGRVKFLEISEFPGLEGWLDIDSKILEIASNASGKPLREVLDELREVGITGLDEYEKISSYLKRWSIYRNRYLNLVMKQMLLMGGSRIGAKRAFLFALENKLDISVPLKYGLDSSDPKERYFINEYLNAGGDPDLVCYINYMSDSKSIPQTIRECLKFRNASGKIPYTNEEKQLHSRLVLALTRHPNYKS